MISELKIRDNEGTWDIEFVTDYINDFIPGSHLQDFNSINQTIDFICDFLLEE